MENINELLKILTPLLIVLVGSGGLIAKIMETRKSKKERENIKETLKNGLHEIDKKQNEKLQDLNLKVDELLILNKVEKNKKKLSKSLKNYLCKFQKDKGLGKEYSELNMLLTANVNTSIEAFCNVIDEGIKDVNLDTLRNDLYSRYQAVRNNTNKAKLGVGIEFRKVLKEKATTQHIHLYLVDLKTYQSSLTNGELYEKFTSISSAMVQNITIYTYNIYKELREK